MVKVEVIVAVKVEERCRGSFDYCEGCERDSGTGVNEQSAVEFFFTDWNDCFITGEDSNNDAENHCANKLKTHDVEFASYVNVSKGLDWV